MNLAALCASAFLCCAMTVALGCDRLQRFPTCHSDQECTERETGQQAPLCVNLKCVACRYDTDCAAGEICSSTNRCDRLTSTEPEERSDGPGAPTAPTAPKSHEK